MTRYLLPLLLMLPIAVGCSKHPAGPEGPEITAEGVGQRALEQLDKNGDGQLDKQELKASPGLQSALERFDTSGDGKLTADEISARVQVWLDSGTTIMSGNTIVTMGGAPLDEAQITYEPEPFLGPAFKPGSGTTNQQGVARMQGQDANFPGVYIGLYRVKISKQAGGNEMIPGRYNEETTLGVEIAEDFYPEDGMVRFDL